MEITTQIGCKNNCIYCPQDVFQQAYYKRFGNNEVKLNLEFYKLLLEKIPKHVNIAFSGMSEPSFHPNFIEMIKHTHNSGYYVRVNSTCQGLKKESILKIKNIPFYSFAVHLPNENDDISKIPLDDLHLEKIRWIENQKIKNLQFRSVGNVHPTFKEALKSSIYEAKVYTRANNLEKEKISGFITKKLKTSPKSGHNRISCSRVFNNILNRNILLPNGSVLICCMDYGVKHIIGNLKKMSYTGLFNSSDYHSFTKRMHTQKASICQNCEAAFLTK